MTQAMHLHIGGAGVKIGDFLWRLYEKEKADVQYLNHIYTEDGKGNYSPNVLFADLDVKGKEDAADNFAKGRYTTGRKIIAQTLEQIRQQIEEMDYFEQFIVTSSVSGGTGSGFLCHLLNKLSQEYRNKQKIGFFVYPSQNQSNNVVGFYNAVLCTETMQSDYNSVILFDNESIYNILDKYLELDLIDYNQINNIISQVISSYTGLQRFNGISNVLNNLIPFPYQNFITPSYGPLCSINDYQFKELNENALIKQIIQKDSKLNQCNEDPIHLSSALINRQQKLNNFYGQFSTPLSNINHYFSTSTKLYQYQAKNYQIIPELKELKQTNIFLSNDATVKTQLKNLIVFIVNMLFAIGIQGKISKIMNLVIIQGIDYNKQQRIMKAGNQEVNQDEQSSQTQSRINFNDKFNYLNRDNYIRYFNLPSNQLFFKPFILFIFIINYNLSFHSQLKMLLNVGQIRNYSKISLKAILKIQSISLQTLFFEIDEAFSNKRLLIFLVLKLHLQQVNHPPQVMFHIPELIVQTGYY